MSNDTAPPTLADSVNLDEGRALLENATPGPWKIGKAMTDEVAICDDTAGVIAVRRGLYANRGDANAELICWARNNLPALLSRVAALQTALRDVIEGAIETGSADHCAHIARTALREPQRPRQSAR